MPRSNREVRIVRGLTPGQGSAFHGEQFILVRNTPWRQINTRVVHLDSRPKVLVMGPGSDLYLNREGCTAVQAVIRIDNRALLNEAMDLSISVSERDLDEARLGIIRDPPRRGTPQEHHRPIIAEQVDKSPHE